MTEGLNDDAAADACFKQTSEQVLNHIKSAQALCDEHGLAGLSGVLLMPKYLASQNREFLDHFGRDFCNEMAARMSGALVTSFREEAERTNKEIRKKIERMGEDESGGVSC